MRTYFEGITSFAMPLCGWPATVKARAEGRSQAEGGQEQARNRTVASRRGEGEEEGDRRRPGSTPQNKRPKQLQRHVCCSCMLLAGTLFDHSTQNSAEVKATEKTSAAGEDVSLLPGAQD